MDFWGTVIILSILASGLIMIIGPIMEMRGKILFLESKTSPKITGRWGMGLMGIALLLFFGGLVLRTVFSSEVVTPIVIGGFILWFVGGITAVIRNETLKIMLENTVDSAKKKKWEGIDNESNGI